MRIPDGGFQYLFTCILWRLLVENYSLSLRAVVQHEFGHTLHPSGFRVSLHIGIYSRTCQTVLRAVYISARFPYHCPLRSPQAVAKARKMPAPNHVQAATLQRFLDAWKNWNAREWLDIFAPDIVQVTMPLSLGIPPRSRAEVEQTLPALIATVTSYEVRKQSSPYD
jgi:hypothetical protein